MEIVFCHAVCAIVSNSLKSSLSKGTLAVQLSDCKFFRLGCLFVFSTLRILYLLDSNSLNAACFFGMSCSNGTSGSSGLSSDLDFVLEDSLLEFLPNFFVAVSEVVLIMLFLILVGVASFCLDFTT